MNSGLGVMGSGPYSWFGCSIRYAMTPLGAKTDLGMTQVRQAARQTGGLGGYGVTGTRRCGVRK